MTFTILYIGKYKIIKVMSIELRNSIGKIIIK